jgi:hypothetical protein
MARHVRKTPDVRIMAHPPMPITATQPRGLNANQRPTRPRDRVRNDLNPRPLPKGLIDHSAHEQEPTWRARLETMPCLVVSTVLGRGLTRWPERYDREPRRPAFQRSDVGRRAPRQATG